MTRALSLPGDPFGKATYRRLANRMDYEVLPVVWDEGELRERLVAAARSASCRYGGRWSLRAFLRHGVSPAVEGIDWNGHPIWLEARVPVRGHPHVACMAYYGANVARRCPSSEARNAERLAFVRALERVPFGGTHVAAARVERLEFPSEQDIADLLSIYERWYASRPFEIDRAFVLSLGRDGCLAVARDERRSIVAACAAEAHTYGWPGMMPMRVVEIGKDVVRADARWLGLRVALLRSLLDLFLDPGDPVPTVALLRVRAASEKLIETCLSLGCAYAGLLPMHEPTTVPLDANLPTEGKHANFIVFSAQST